MVTTDGLVKDSNSPYLAIPTTWLPQENSVTWNPFFSFRKNGHFLHVPLHHFHLLLTPQWIFPYSILHKFTYTILIFQFFFKPLPSDFRKISLPLSFILPFSFGNQIIILIIIIILSMADHCGHIANDTLIPKKTKV